MAKKKFYIVWNTNKNEGFITDDKDDAKYTSAGSESSSFARDFGTPVVGDAFRDCYADGKKLPMQTVELDV